MDTINQIAIIGFTIIAFTAVMITMGAMGITTLSRTFKPIDQIDEFLPGAIAVTSWCTFVITWIFTLCLGIAYICVMFL